MEKETSWTTTRTGQPHESHGVLMIPEYSQWFPLKEVMMWVGLAGEAGKWMWLLLHTPLSSPLPGRGGTGWQTAEEQWQPQGVWQWVWPAECRAGLPVVGLGTCQLSSFQNLDWNLDKIGMEFRRRGVGDNDSTRDGRRVERRVIPAWAH